MTRARAHRLSVKFRRNGPGLLILASIVVILGITAASHLLTKGLLDSAKANEYRLMREVLASILKSTEDRALVRAELVASSEAVRSAFVARDRPKLLAETERMFKIQQEKYGLDQAQFHVPPGVSFLRLHNPAKFGDDQTSYRPMLTDVNANKVLRRGVAITKAGPAISGIVPMFDDAGKHVGSFEMGLEFAPMLDKIKQAYGIEAAVYIDEKLLRDIATDLGGDILTPKNRVGRFMRYHATHPDLIAALVTDREVDVTGPANYERVFNGTLWGVQLVPMYSYSGKQLGVYALATNMSDAQSAARRAQIWALLAALLGVVGMSATILVVVRGVVLRPVAALGERMQALADGDASQPADPLDSYAEELVPLATSYERLRKERES
jgi:methyl-accepting chemotaxis protein